MNGPIEPRADLRAAANDLRQLYLSLIQEDFSESEALTLIGHILAASRGAA